MKHEYASDELRELKSIYNESGEAGLSRDEMRALRKAGLVKQDLPPEPEKPHEDTLADYQAVSDPTPKPAEQAEPSKRDLILAHCKKRIDQGQPFDGKETAEALGLSPKTVGNILSQLRKEGLLPAFDKHSPRSKAQKTTTTEKKKETIMAVTSKPAASKGGPMSQGITANKETAPEKQCENTRAIITNALVGIYDSISALQRAAYHANDKVVYMFATKLLDGELMDLKANYSKDAK